MIRTKVILGISAIVLGALSQITMDSTIATVDAQVAHSITGGQSSCGNTLMNGYQTCGVVSCDQSGLGDVRLTGCGDIAVYVANGSGDWKTSNSNASCTTCANNQDYCTKDKSVPNQKIPATCR